MNSKRVFQRAEVSVAVQMHLNEQEARALYALTVYGTKNLMQVFQKTMGSAADEYLDGLFSLFSAAREELPLILSRADEARKAFGNGK